VRFTKINLFGEEYVPPPEKISFRTWGNFTGRLARLTIAVKYPLIASPIGNVLRPGAERQPNRRKLHDRSPITQTRCLAVPTPWRVRSVSDRASSSCCSLRVVGMREGRRSLGGPLI
jgi:hypothetical protein